MLKKDDIIFVTGHTGMVGSEIVRFFNSKGYTNIKTATRSELDLTNQQIVNRWFSKNKIKYVIIAAGKVGGIKANAMFPAEFIYQNLMIVCNVIQAAYENGIHDLLYLGSSCIYPKFANQPIAESELLSGKLEPTNEPYAIAKISGIKLCESFNRQYDTNYRSLMPTNLYGEGDNYDLENSHVLPALIKRFHEAKKSKADLVKVWGSGNAKREFLHVEDLVSAALHVIRLSNNIYFQSAKKTESHVNVGSGEEISIKELAENVKKVVGFEGELNFDKSKPEGTPRKKLDISKIKSFGWNPTINLEEGLFRTYKWFKQHYDV